MLKTEIKYGLITGIGICLWILGEYLLGFHTTQMHAGEHMIYFVVIIPLVTIYLGLKEKRDKRLNGKISLGNGIKAGLMISLIAAIIIVFFLVIYFNYINPQYTELSINFYKNKLALADQTEIQQTKEIENIHNMFGFINQLLFSVLGTISIGLLVSAGVSLYLKKNTIIH